MMENELIHKTIQQLDIPEKALIVLSNIPPSVFMLQSIEYQPLIELEPIYAKNLDKWDAAKIEEASKVIIRELLFLENQRIVPAEFIQFISNKFDITEIDVPVFVITNNATDFTPCFVNGDFESLYEKIESELVSTDESALSDYYVNSIKTEYGLFVQSNVSSLFKPELLNVHKVFDLVDVPIQGNSTSNSKQFDFNHLSTDYFHLVAQYYQSKLPLSFEILIQTKEQATDELCYFITACTHRGHSINVVQSRKASNAFIRPDIKTLRDKYWAKGSDFRLVTFYADPAISNETVQISQGEVVEQIVKQAENASSTGIIEDVFITAPTGAGKSLLFQLAAIYLADKHKMVSIVISPLKSLMKDQVDNLKEQGYDAVAFINSDISLIQREEILESVKNGEIDILYLAPELLLSYSLDFFIGTRSLGLLVVDEAHLVTTWGRDFRVDYWFLGNYIRKIRQLYHQKCIIVALTATAVYGGPDDLVFETVSSLNMLLPKLYIGVVRRDDIDFEVTRTEFETDYETSRNNLTVKKVESLLNNDTKSIVYFPWTNQIDKVYEQFRGKPVKLAKYHSKLGKEYRLQTADEFRAGNINTILASKAFGMGVDIPDIQYVYHHTPSGTLADYVQEIGRAARLPNMRGTAAIDFSIKDLRYTKVLWGLSAIRQWQVKQALNKLISLYKFKRKRNFLVNIDDFSYIFPNAMDDMKENKIKSTLMLIEKDFLKKHRYPVVLVRPKSLFTTVFLRVENSIKDDFTQKYGGYLSKLEGDELELNTSPLNEVFKIKLGKLWEELRPELGFPSVKYEFYNGTLFGDYSDKVHPQLRLMIKLNNSISQTRTALDTSLSLVEKVLGSLSGRFFRRSEFLEALDKEFFRSETAESISDVFLNYYSSKMTRNPRTGRYYIETAGAFLQQRKQGDETTFKVIDFGFGKAKESIRKLFNKRFNTSSIVSAYITTDRQKNRERILLAYVLEGLKLGVYELQGGEKPQLFIRINDPNKVLAEMKYYQNSIVDEIELRHYNSINIMENFFTSEMSTQERWNFIENYFLGNYGDDEGDS